MRSSRESNKWSKDYHQTLLTDIFPIFDWSPGVPILDNKQQVPEDFVEL